MMEGLSLSGSDKQVVDTYVNPSNDQSVQVTALNTILIRMCCGSTLCKQDLNTY